MPLPTIARYAEGLELRVQTVHGAVSIFLPEGEASRWGVRLIEADLALAWARIAAARRDALVPGDDPGDMR